MTRVRDYIYSLCAAGTQRAIRLPTYATPIPVSTTSYYKHWIATRSDYPELRLNRAIVVRSQVGFPVYPKIWTGTDRVKIQPLYGEQINFL